MKKKQDPKNNFFQMSLKLKECNKKYIQTIFFYFRGLIYTSDRHHNYKGSI